MVRRSLGPDAWGTMEEWVEIDDQGNATIGFTGRNDARLEANQQLRNDGSNGFSPSHELRKIIELDPPSIMLIASMYGVKPMSREFDELVLKLAQSSDWKGIKTVDGGVRNKIGGRRG